MSIDKRTKITPTRTCNHTPVRNFKADCYRANVSGNEIYGGVRINAKKLRREAAKQQNPLLATRTCLNCAVRCKCSGYDSARTAPCVSKVAPLPPVRRFGF